MSPSVIVGTQEATALETVSPHHPMSQAHPYQHNPKMTMENGWKTHATETSDKSRRAACPFQ